MRWFGFIAALLVLGPALGQGPEDVEALERHVKKLEVEIQKARELGQGDRAEDLAREIEKARGRLEEIARARRDPGPERGRMVEAEKIEAQLRELEGAIREAKERGQPDRAEKLAREAEKARGRLEEIARAPKEPGPGDERKAESDRLKLHLRELEGAIREAKDLGQRERAEELAREIEKARGRLEEIGRAPKGPGPGDERKAESDRLKLHLRELEGAIREAKDLGQRERAEELAREIEKTRGRLEEIARAPKGPGPGDERKAESDRLKLHLRELEGAIREAKELGQRERAEELAREIEAVQARMREFTKGPTKGPRPEGGPEDKMVDMVARLRMEAIRAKRDGQAERARDLWAEASRIEGELGQMAGFGPGGPGGKHGAPGERPGGPPPEEIRREIERLRAEVRDLRALLDRALGDRPRADRERPDGERPDRERPDRERPGFDRERADRERPDRERPDRERPDRERPDGERPEGERPERERPEREGDRDRQ